MKKWLTNFVVAGISLVLTLLLVEVVLRVLLFNGIAAFEFLRVPKLYANFERDQTEHLYKEDYWKMRAVFYQIPDMAQPHALLGWIGNFNPQTYEHADEFFAKGKRPVLLFGDSFSQCVDTTQCFEDFLNSDTTFSNQYYLLNFGVGGFGIDQTSLLMGQVIPRFKNPIVIYGMLTTDMDRSMLQFRDAPKPYFELENGELSLKGVPVELKTSEYIEQHPMEVNSYVLSLVRNSFKWLMKTKVTDETKREEEALNEAIIRNQISLLNEAEIDPIMLLFQPMNQVENEWRSAFLKDLFSELLAKTLDTRALLLKHLESTLETEEDFFIPKDLHPNSNYNKLISEEIKRVVLSKDTISP